MKDGLYWIAGPWPGRLGIAARPRGGDWLSEEVQAWRRAGVDAVVSLLTPEEESELGLEAEPILSRESGLRFHAFPIPDLGVPSSRLRFVELVHRLDQELAAGKNVAVHCRQGIGRSGLLASSLLVSAGQRPDQAFRRVEQARGVPVPETAEQRRWVEGLAEELLPTRSESPSAA